MFQFSARIACHALQTTANWAHSFVFTSTEPAGGSCSTESSTTFCFLGRQNVVQLRGTE